MLGFERIASITSLAVPVADRQHCACSSLLSASVLVPVVGLVARRSPLRNPIMASPRPRSPLPSAADIASNPLAAAASVVSHLPSLSSLSSSLSSVRSVRSSLNSALNEHAPGLSSTLHRLRNEAPTSLSSALDSLRDEAPSLSSALHHVRDGTVSSAVQGRLARYKEKAGEVVARVQLGEDETEKKQKERSKRKEEKAARKHRLLRDSVADGDSGRSSKRTSQPASDDEMLHAGDSMDIVSPALSASSATSLSAPSTPALSAAAAPAASPPASAPASPSQRPESPPSPAIDPTVWPSFEPSALFADLTALLSSPPSASLLSPSEPSLLSLPPPEPFATAVDMLRAYDEMCANVALQRTELADMWAGMQGGLATAEKEVQWLQAELVRLESERQATPVR